MAHPSISEQLDQAHISRTSLYRWARQTGLNPRHLLELLTTYHLTRDDIEALIKVQRLTPEQVHAFYHWKP
jgi:hypothetical protein